MNLSRRTLLVIDVLGTAWLLASQTRFLDFGVARALNRVGLLPEVYDNAALKAKRRQGYIWALPPVQSEKCRVGVFRKSFTRISLLALKVRWSSKLALQLDLQKRDLTIPPPKKKQKPD